MSEYKPTVVLDFDGVIHSYTSGWQGETVIPDPPVPGIKEAIDGIREAGYKVVVVSTRCARYEGQREVYKWLVNHGIMVDGVSMEKPPAIVYIDDRAICFDGRPDNLLEKIKNFEPWYKEAPKRRIDWFRGMDIKNAAALLMMVTNKYCDGGCGAVFACPHEMTCAIQWLAEETDESPWPEVQRCRICGCTWDNACPGGCYWVEDALCSECVEEARKLEGQTPAEERADDDS